MGDFFNEPTFEIKAIIQNVSDMLGRWRRKVEKKLCENDVHNWEREPEKKNIQPAKYVHEDMGIWNYGVQKCTVFCKRPGCSAKKIMARIVHEGPRGYFGEWKNCSIQQSDDIDQLPML